MMKKVLLFIWRAESDKVVLSARVKTDASLPHRLKGQASHDKNKKAEGL